MTIAATATRENKEKWLLRPAEWASTLSFFGGIFGFVHWYFGFYESDTLVVALCAILIANYALLVWGTARLTNVTRGRL